MDLKASERRKVSQGFYRSLMVMWKDVHRWPDADQIDVKALTANPYHFVYDPEELEDLQSTRAVR